MTQLKPLNISGPIPWILWRKKDKEVSDIFESLEILLYQNIYQNVVNYKNF